MTESLNSRTAQPSGDGLMAAACLAVDPLGLGGITVRTDRGAGCEQWLLQLQRLLDGHTVIRRLPPHVDDERLLGGTDLTASLRAGRAVYARGLLAEADGGILIMSLAERVSSHLAALVAAALDSRSVCMVGASRQQAQRTRFAVVALDSGEGEDEHCNPLLAERLAMQIDLRAVPPDAFTGAKALRSQVLRARRRLGAVSSEPSDLKALCATAAACGIDSMRAPLWALRVARASAALRGAKRLQSLDLERAVRWVIAPRARQVPEQPAEEAPADAVPDGQANAAPPPDSGASNETSSTGSEDLLLAAARAALPAGLLDADAPGELRLRSRSPGRAGAILAAGRRGRPAGVRAGRPRGEIRLNIVATLRCAAPWQRLRHAQSPAAAARVLVHVDDFRFTWFKPRSETATVFVLDASGSSAMSRLAEAKGAIELLLAECYVRRDQVAVAAFRGRGAQLLLPATRSLVRAKRCLAQLAGGGATPLAAGLDLGRELADQLRRRGLTPTVVVLTDGQANVARDGTGGRERAASDAVLAARGVRAAGLRTLLIDTARRPQVLAQSLAQTMRARYLPLPYADARALLSAVKSAG